MNSPMSNRELYFRDPTTLELLNNGVSKVAEIGHNEGQIKTLRFELETFVCDGEYARGLERILKAYLVGLGQAEQQAVWVSGFFGSGKSHLVKVLRYLWEDYHFAHGATARSLVTLPAEIADLLKELSTRSRAMGGLRAAAGTLGAGSMDNVRLAFIQLVLRAAGLPENLAQAKFILWLRSSGLEAKVADALKQQNRELGREVLLLKLSMPLAEALVSAEPKYATAANAQAAIRDQFKDNNSPSIEDALDVVRQIFGPGGQLPCTLLVLDEIQQFIGEKIQRANDIQEIAEHCCTDTLLPIWAFVSSEKFRDEVRRIDQSMKITNVTFLKVPFDLAHWQKVAAEKYPHGLPKPFSSDAMQWLFNGHPAGADQPLQVAVARLLGYQWPRQTGSSFPDCPALAPDGLETLADEDGIVCLSATKGEAAAAERLRELLARAYGQDWNATQQAALLAQVDYAGSTLEDWLRNGFFEQHCKLFHNRPFIWHLWDGHKSGFSALVNYHQLTHANLEKLTYAYLGDWIRRQQAAVDAGEAGSDARLQSAKQLQSVLKLILEGEPPYDIFVRWKPLAQQAIGWHPDLNDGVRMNLRPFLATDIPGGKKGAGLLRAKPNIKWEKDRGKEPQRAKAEFPWFWHGSTFTGDRVNDVHLTREQKARQ